jgi:hypothetical protein
MIRFLLCLLTSLIAVGALLLLGLGWATYAAPPIIKWFNSLTPDVQELIRMAPSGGALVFLLAFILFCATEPR